MTPSNATARPLPQRPLGRTGMDITRVGFGVWAIGGGGWAFAWGEQDDAESVAAIRHAAERGINWIDTAAVYGNGHSEEVVARALREIPARERPYVFTKCGLVWDEKNPMVQARRVGTPPACAGSWRPPCAGWASSGSTCGRCTGRPKTARRSRNTGARSWT